MSTDDTTTAIRDAYTARMAAIPRDAWADHVTAAFDRMTFGVARVVTPAAEGRVSNNRMAANGWENRDRVRFHVTITDADGNDVYDAVTSGWTPMVYTRRRDAVAAAAATRDELVAEWSDVGSWFAYTDDHITDEALAFLGIPTA